ncbi:MAG: alpha/beta hydrolase [Acidobacteria bacterium]|nr:alpha/beta hydrolase [Acidobacteriota bacterium]
MQRAFLILTTWAFLSGTQVGYSIPPGEKFQDIVYAQAGDRDLLLDLYLPTEGKPPFPTIVWIHGGGWIGGSKENPQALEMKRWGYAVASIEYRLLTEALFPAQIEDCKAALRWLRAHAQDYGLDPDRMGVWGASAGGHLAALLGTSAGVPELEGSLGNLEHSSRVQAVCDFYGPTDMLSYHPLLKDLLAVYETLNGANTKLEQVRKWAALANPISYISKDDPPFLIMHGDEDPTVPVEQSELLARELERAGVPVRLTIWKGRGHSLQGEDVLQAVRAFFDETLKPREVGKHGNGWSSLPPFVSGWGL